MSTYETIWGWVKDLEINSIPLPDGNGQCSVALGDDFVLNLVVNPKPEANIEDSLYLYIPIFHIDVSEHSITSEKKLKMLTYIAKQNLPGILPSGFRIGFLEESHFFILSARYDGTKLASIDLQNNISQLSSHAYIHRDMLRKIALDKIEVSDNLIGNHSNNSIKEENDAQNMDLLHAYMQVNSGIKL